MKDRFSRLIHDSQQTVEYWRDIAVTDFTRDLHDRMQRMGVTRAELARRMGTSRSYVTKLLEGEEFTLEVMVKLSMALDGVMRVHIADNADPPL